MMHDDASPVPTGSVTDSATIVVAFKNGLGEATKVLFILPL